jgi:hypothetical protein
MKSFRKCAPWSTNLCQTFTQGFLELSNHDLPHAGLHIPAFHSLATESIRIKRCTSGLKGLVARWAAGSEGKIN